MSQATETPSTRPPLMPAALARLARLPSALLVGAIGLYQRTVSPLLPIVTAGACACRFAPTCSHYAAEAIRVHGAVRGSWLGLRRLVKCTPLHPGGFDPVPARQDGRGSGRPMAVRWSREFSCHAVTNSPPGPARP